MSARFFPIVEKVARAAMKRRGFASRNVSGSGIPIHVYDALGSGTAAPVVFFHGLGSAGSAFGPLAARVRPHVRRVLIPELPGHGFSGRDERPVTPEILLEAMTDVLDALLDEPATVYGNSLGGAVAIKYALARPERVKQLVLVSPAGAPLTPGDRGELVSLFGASNRAEALTFLNRLYHEPPWFLPWLSYPFPELLARPVIREILSKATNEKSPTPDELASLRMPILFIWGQSEKLLPPSALAYFRSHFPPHAIVEEPKGFGHTPHLEVPIRVADRMIAFVRDGA